MRATVVKPFRYSTDGVQARRLKVGEEFDCRDDLALGLEAEGFIRPVQVGAETRALRPDPGGGPPRPVKASQLDRRSPRRS